MWQCHYCRLALTLEMQLKNRLCPGCGSDIHCCQNCTHYKEALSSKCEEPNSPWVSDRSVQNHCPFFEFRTVSQSAPQKDSAQSTTEAEQAKEAFRALFRTP